jgi:hypothetical protein
MLYYSAESVIAELKANDALECEGIDDLSCPSSVPSSFTHEKTCPGDPSACDDCTNQLCSQRIIVREYSGKKITKLGVLFFLFFFANSPHGGRVPVMDSPLELLIQRKLIDKAKLKIC